MTNSFINSLQDIVQIYSDNATSTPTCDEAIDHYTFYQYCLIPSFIITAVYAFSKRRRNILKNLLDGRPGLLFPMDALTRSSRISFGCAFGATSFLVYDIVLNQKYAIDYNGDRAVKSFVAIGSMFIYGMVFFPVFASLAIGSAFSFGVGSLYVWAITAVDIFKQTECDLSSRDRALVVCRGLPSLLCFVYLSVSMPVRMVKAFMKGNYFYWEEEKSDTIEDIRSSYAGHHVLELLKKPVVELPPEGRKGRIFRIAKGLFKRFVYERQKGFRYSARMITVVFISVIVVYTIAFELLVLIPSLFQSLQDVTIFYLDMTIGLDPFPGEDSETTTLRDMIYIAWWLFGIMKICGIVSTIVAAVFAILNILHTLSSYRANLFAMYRGDYSHIPPLSSYSNVSHCVNSIKYAGFQVGYVIWSYLIQFGLLFLVTFIIAFIVLMIVYDFTSILVLVLELVWPLVVTTLIILIGQILLAKFVFLQDRGAYMALNNRSSFFCFTYFMFFYNIFLGLVSCLLRILKAMGVGIAFLGRLDNSTLPRKFEFLDPGFKAYVGYMHIEAAHTHPVAVIFCRLMLLGLEKKRARIKARQQAMEGSKAMIEVNDGGDDSRPVSTVSSSGLISIEMKSKKVNSAIDDEIKIAMQDQQSDRGRHDVSQARKGLEIPAEEMSEEEWRRKVGARFSWNVAFTLLHNPDIRVMRKGYVNMLRQARLLGVSVPVSDTQADINFDQLQQNIADAKERMNPTKKKKNGKGDKDGQYTDLEVKVEGGLKKAPSVTQAFT